MDDSLEGSPIRRRPQPKKKDPMDDPLESGTHVPTRKQRMNAPPKLLRRRNSEDKDDLDASEYDDMIEKAPPRRSLSAELESSLVIGENNWKTLETVHMRCDDSGDSDSFMGDSFAGASFTSSQNSWVEDESDFPASQFTALDDEAPPDAKSPLGAGVSPRKAAPRRTYSKQSKRMPKKVDPLSAITEDDDGDADAD